jgi:glycine hydroxymethyltransferase
MKEPEMVKVAELITRSIENYNNPEKKKEIRKEVNALCEQFPIYPELK